MPHAGTGWTAWRMIRMCSATNASGGASVIMYMLLCSVSTRCSSPSAQVLLSSLCTHLPVPCPPPQTLAPSPSLCLSGRPLARALCVFSAPLVPAVCMSISAALSDEEAYDSWPHSWTRMQPRGARQHSVPYSQHYSHVQHGRPSCKDSHQCLSTALHHTCHDGCNSHKPRGMYNDNNCSQHSSTCYNNNMHTTTAQSWLPSHRQHTSVNHS